MMWTTIKTQSGLAGDMNGRKKALALYLSGTLGQIWIVCFFTFILRNHGIDVNFTTFIGLIANGIGGISSALCAKTSFSQFAAGGNQYVLFICRIVEMQRSVWVNNGYHVLRIIRC